MTSLLQSQSDSILVRKDSLPILKETPVVGVLTNPRAYGTFNTYIMGAYIKFLELGGARVVAIPHTNTGEQILQQLEKLNGVLLPGGAVPVFDQDFELTMYATKVKLILQKAKEFNENGVYFPIWGVCLGFQMAAGIEAPYKDVVALDVFDAVDTSDVTKFEIDPTESKVYRNMPERMLEAIQTEGISYNSHHDGVHPEVFQKYDNLRDNYRVVSTNTDRKGVEYVAFFEHKKYPLYFIQFHPEKVLFIYKEGLNIPRTENALEVSKYYAEFFVHECRLNANHYPTVEEELAADINNGPTMQTWSVSMDVFGFNEPVDI